jgi:hypothetical protein
MSIIRIEKRSNPFAIIDKRCLEDTSLSWRAKGMLAYLISRPDNWKVCVHHLVGVSEDGRDANYSILRELRDAGYVTKVESRDELGMITSTDYVVTEVPSNPNEPVSGQADSGQGAANNNDSNKNDINDILPQQETAVQDPAEPDRPKTPRDVMNTLTHTFIAIENLYKPEMTNADYNRIRAAIKRIFTACPTVNPSEVLARAEVYKAKFKGAAITANAIASHWAGLRPADQSVKPQVKFCN